MGGIMAKNDNGRICAILSYIALIGVIWYLIDKKLHKDDLAKFHVKQGIILVLTSIALNVVAGVIPFIGGAISAIAGIFEFVLFILGIINAATSKKKELPLVGQFSKYLNF